MPGGRELGARTGSSDRAQFAILAAKLAVTGICFWYLIRTVDTTEFMRVARSVDLRWAALSAAVLALETPVVGVRWGKIVDVLASGGFRGHRLQVIAITAIGNFFAQVMPNVAADSVRVWMLTQLSRPWPQAIASVIMDRAAGVGALIAVAFVILLFPSELTALGGHRPAALVLFGAVLAAASGTVVLARWIAPLLESWRYTIWLGKLARAAHQVFMGSSQSFAIVGLALGVHVMTIVAVWLLGQASGLSLSPLDAAAMFTVVLAAALIPVSIGGWGVREVAVTSVLGGHGVPLEQALLFSVGFGLVFLASALPGAAVWALYSPRKPSQAAAPT